MNTDDLSTPITHPHGRPRRINTRPLRQPRSQRIDNRNSIASNNRNSVA